MRNAPRAGRLRQTIASASGTGRRASATTDVRRCRRANPGLRPQQRLKLRSVSPAPTRSRDARADLGPDESEAQAPSNRAGGASAVLEGQVHVLLRQLKGQGREPEHEPGRNREQKREPEHAAVEGEVFEADDLDSFGVSSRRAADTSLLRTNVTGDPAAGSEAEHEAFGQRLSGQPRRPAPMAARTAISRRRPGRPGEQQVGGR